MGARYRYFIYGFLFGCLFPIGALILEMVTKHLNFSSQNIRIAHQNNLLLYMIDSAPLFLGLFAMLGGVSKEKTELLVVKFKDVYQILLASYNRLNQNAQGIVEAINKSNQVFETISEEIKALSLEGKSNLEKNEQMTEVLQKESERILSTANKLISLNEDLNNSSLSLSNELKYFLPKIEELNNNLSKVGTFGSEINILALNSGIEANKLGESGKSFTIISKEVKGLSDKINAMNQSMHMLLQDSKDHVSNLQNHLGINKDAQSGISNTSGMINKSIQDYYNVINKVSVNLKETSDVYNNITIRYDKIMSDILKNNIENQDRVDKLNLQIEKEVNMVMDMNNKIH